MIYEKRCYNIPPARKAEYLDLLEKTALPLLVKHGAKVVGVWETAVSETNEVTYILAFRDISRRMACWEKFSKEEQFLELRPTLPTDSISVSILRPTAYSPLK